MNKTPTDIRGKTLDKDDQILYATTHGEMQFGRVLEVLENGFIKVIGKENKRELTIKTPEKQTHLFSKGYYIKIKKRNA